MFRYPACRRKESLAAGSMFDGSHIALLYFWRCETGVTQTTHHVGVSCATVVQWYQYVRDICAWNLLQTPIILGLYWAALAYLHNLITIKSHHSTLHLWSL